jgi:hypothetical protein
MVITKENILSKVSTYEILNYYLCPYHKSERLMAGKNISNPFLNKKQDTPSFNIHCALPSHEWRYKDFATGDDGSCFDLVMKLFNLTFIEALDRINADLNLMIKNTNGQNKPIEIPIQNKVDFQIKAREFYETEINYWFQYGITTSILNKFKVLALVEFSSFNKEGKPYTIKSSIESPIFAFENNEWVKLYKPLGERKYRFQYLGNKEPDFIFGWNQLPEKGELIFITGGEKDVMSLAAKGYNAVSLNSETASIKPNIINELKTRFQKIIVLYDNDETGIRQAERISSTHNLLNLKLNPIPNNGKDISDYFLNHGTAESFEALLLAKFQETQVNEINLDKVVFNAVELMAMGNTEPQYLMSPIFPQKGTAVLAGKPDTGKSQFARQLCIQVAMGLKSFIDFELNPIHNRSIYVATEDNQENTRYLMNRQMNGLNQSPKENLRFIFADTMEQEEILKELDSELTKVPADLVVVDSFGDIFKGGDSNNNMAMRNTVKIFDKIAKKHNCLILFVHHINKGAYRQAPGQEHIQGGAGLMQKVRLGIQLSEGDNNTRYFTVVKGNYCPKEYKQNSIVLNFSEVTFLFSNTGKLIPTGEIGTQPNEEKKEEKYSELENIAMEIFGNKLISYSNFVKYYCEITGKSVPTAKRAHANLKKLEMIVETNGSYRLANQNNDTFSDDEDDETTV